MNCKSPPAMDTTPKGRPVAILLGRASPASRTPSRPTGLPAKAKSRTAKTFLIDGREIDIREGETIFRAARRLGIKLPHLCYSPKPGYRPDGNCRVCMVEVEGERVLAASCIRMPARRHEGKDPDRPRQERAQDGGGAAGHRSAAARRGARSASELWKIVDAAKHRGRPLPAPRGPPPDRSHPAMAVNLDACIHCNLCVRACREVQVNDVIGMAGRGHGEKIVFDFDDPMGASTCVACGECVQACPTGALMPATLVDEANVRTPAHFPDRAVNSVCPYCGVGCQLTYQIKDDKLLYVERPQRAGEPEPALRQGPLRLRLRQQSAAPDAADDPQGRRRQGRRRSGRSVQSMDAFPPSDLGGGDGSRRFRPHENPRPRRPACARRLRLGQGLERRGLSVPEARAHRLRLQQCRSLHAAVPRVLGGGAAGRRRLRRRDRDLQRVQELRRHHRHRRQSDREPSGRRHLLQAGGQARRQARRHGPARPGAQAPRLADDAIQERHRRGDAQRHAQCHHRREALRPAIRADLYRGLRQARRDA